MLKESNLLMKYCSEFIFTSIYLYTELSVIGRTITPYEARIKYKPCLHHLRPINQSEFIRNRKFYIRWKYFQDHSTKNILICYKKEHIY